MFLLKLSETRGIVFLFEFSYFRLLAEVAAKICEPKREGRKIKKYRELAD